VDENVAPHEGQRALHAVEVGVVPAVADHALGKAGAKTQERAAQACGTHQPGRRVAELCERHVASQSEQEGGRHQDQRVRAPEADAAAAVEHGQSHRQGDEAGERGGRVLGHERDGERQQRKSADDEADAVPAAQGEAGARQQREKGAVHRLVDRADQKPAEQGWDDDCQSEKT